MQRNIFGAKPMKNKPLQLFFNEIQACKKCKLCNEAMNIKKGKLPGAGYENADTFMIGLSCGWYREKEIFAGTPFNIFIEEINQCESNVGAGTKRILLELLEVMEIEKKDLYITNLIKCSPPKDREPTYTEIVACLHWLRKEILAVEPKKIICLGTKVSECFRLHPISSEKRERTVIVSIYHPGFFLRSGRKDLYDKIRKEVKKYEL